MTPRRPPRLLAPLRGALSCGMLMFGLTTALAVASDRPIMFLVDITALMPMPDAQRREMVSETTAIWKPHGVGFTWASEARPEASVPGRAVRIIGDRCQLEPLCLPTRTLEGATAPDSRRLLGAIGFVEGKVTPGDTLMISVDAVGRMVDNITWENRPVRYAPANLRASLIGRALGRVLAHEIGHYLLDFPAHTPEGLMRSEFRADQLIEPHRQGFTLSKMMLPLLRDRLSQLGVDPAPGIARSPSPHEVPRSD